MSQEFKQTMETMQAQIKAMEAQLQERAIEAATSHLPFINNSCRKAAYDLLRPQITKAHDGTYCADNLPLDVYLKQQEWLSGFLSEVPAGAVTEADGPARRETPGSFDLDAIKPGMTAADKDSARAAISRGLAELGHNPMVSPRGVRPL
jgi:hypothetical protein